MATKKKTTKKTTTKKKGLRNPAALAVIPVGGKVASKVNADTGNSLSWIAVFGVGLAAYLAYKVVSTLGKTTDAAGNLIDNINSGITDDPNSGGGNMNNGTTEIPAGSTISTIQAEGIASQLANILGSLGKMNEAEIVQTLNILSGKTPNDYVLISNAFGMVRRNPITGEIAPPLMGFKANLTDWLTLEMQPAGIARLKRVMPGVF